MEFLSLKPNAFGLDISDLSIKIIHLQKKKAGFDLVSFGEHGLKKGIVSKGRIKNQELLTENIKKALEKIKGQKIKTKYIIASLPEEKAFLQVIQMPRLSEKDLKSAIIFEAENYIPLPLEKMYLDSETITPFYNHINKISVLIEAFPKETADQYISCFKKAGLFPIALESESQAIARALVKKQLSPTPLFLVDIGLTKTNFIVFSGRSIRFTIFLPVCSFTFTQAISKTLNIDIKKAEMLKVKYGIGERTKQGKKVFEALIPCLTDFTEQLKRQLSFYQTHVKGEHLPPNGKRIKKMLLTGGGANLKGLDRFLSAELKIPVALANPWVNILSDKPKKIPAISFKDSLKYTTALGLALRGVQGND